MSGFDKTVSDLRPDDRYVAEGDPFKMIRTVHEVRHRRGQVIVVDSDGPVPYELGDRVAIVGRAS